jgi:DNA invertase Pin-like site-specific DNA recombinase
MRVAIYRRVSSEEQALHGFSLEAQREACINKAKEIGATSILEFADEGETGKTLNRPGLESLRQAIADGLIDCVVILDPDRFSRKLSHQLLLTEEFEKAGVELVFVNFEWQDSPEGRLFYSIRGAVSEYEREKITERMKRGQMQKAKQGRPPIGVYHYGYDYDPNTETISINKREAKVVKHIYNSLIQGMTSIDEEQLKLFKSMGASPWQTFRMVKFPAALPGFFAGLKISATYSIMAAVISEWVGAQRGLGFFMTIQQKSFAIDKVLAAVLIICILSLLLVKLVELIEYLLIPWNRSSLEETQH